MPSDNPATHATNRNLAMHAYIDPTTVQYTEYLVRCMEERLQTAQSLRLLADSQSDATAQGDINVTLGFISRKQVLIEHLEVLRIQMQPYFDDDAESRVWVSPQRRQECRELAEAGTRLLQEISHFEQKTLEEMSRQRDAVAAQLQDGRDATLARSAYSADDVLSESALDISNL
ncbi:hypothetical protein [Aureliella helgolandensis]|uniref:FlgN protein n=1 Tax=Aureliella helgolandensis TaxID=2527968 RepID=A0A518GG99_9BACT|nr:hypothetical protein [Aureliella helgolandensis]QDV27625.1 hypothetical protein Q31a_60180 [Aureliella helgolandensis]